MASPWVLHTRSGHRRWLGTPPHLLGRTFARRRPAHSVRSRRCRPRRRPRPRAASGAQSWSSTSVLGINDRKLLDGGASRPADLVVRAVRVDLWPEIGTSGTRDLGGQLAGDGHAVAAGDVRGRVDPDGTVKGSG